MGRHSVRLALAELSEAGLVDRKKKRGTMVTLTTPTPAPGTARSGYALIIPEALSGVYPPLMRGFAEGAMLSRQQSSVYESGTDVYRQGDVILRLIQSHVAGVALVPTYDAMPDHQVQALRSHGMSLVFCHRKETPINAPLITWSGAEVERLAAATLAELGHRRIALMDSAGAQTKIDCLEGFRNELNRSGITFTDKNVFWPDHAVCSPSFFQDADEVMARMLNQAERPTAVFCGDDYVSERVFLAATKAGIRVPQDLSIIGFGPTFRDGPVRAGLAAVAVDEIELGRRAAQILAEISAGHRAADDNEVMVLPLTVLRAESLAKIE